MFLYLAWLINNELSHKQLEPLYIPGNLNIVKKEVKWNYRSVQEYH